MSFGPDVKEKALLAARRSCCICHQFKGTKIVCHHIVHQSEGGEDVFENCIPLCHDCHNDQTSYDHKHPVGTKYTRSELTKHRDRWYGIVAGSSVVEPTSGQQQIELTTEAAFFLAPNQYSNVRGEEVVVFYLCLLFSNPGDRPTSIKTVSTYWRGELVCSEAEGVARISSSRDGDDAKARWWRPEAEYIKCSRDQMLQPGDCLRLVAPLLVRPPAGFPAPTSDLTSLALDDPLIFTAVPVVGRPVSVEVSAFRRWRP